MDNDLTIKQAREAAAHPPGPRPPARAAGAVPRVILGDWLCWVLSGMWGGREWWDPPAAAARVRGEGSAEMRPGARKAAGGDGYPSRMNWGGWGVLWGARGGGGGLFSCFDCRLTRFFTRLIKHGGFLIFLWRYFLGTGWHPVVEKFAQSFFRTLLFWMSQNGVSKLSNL